MEILNENSSYPQQVSLILGFFDGVHAGHFDVIQNTANNCKKVVVTFSKSPAEYFKKEHYYIYSRKNNYHYIENLGVQYLYEQDFAKIANLSAEEYLEKLVKKFNPISITTGFNHTFGANRSGNPNFLEKNQKGFKYFCTPATKIDEIIVSSTKIKEFLNNGEIEKANKFLTRNFILESKVIEGAKLGRKLGYPTANMKYPKDIIKLPYGVYKVRVFDKPAVMNWGIKPTIGSEELIEIHIPNFDANLYKKDLKIEILSKIRNEIKFSSIEDLKLQIEKDVQECLK